MPKAGELDWSELTKSKEEYSHKPTALWVNDKSLGITLKGDAKPLLAKGEVPPTPSNEEVFKEIMRGADAPGLRQPTDEEMFGHLVMSQAQVDAIKAEYDNRMSNTIANLHKPITGKTFEEDEDWGNGKSFNSTLSKSELEKRNMFTGEE